MSQHSCSSLCFRWSRNEAPHISLCPNVPPPQMLPRPHPSIHSHPHPSHTHTTLHPSIQSPQCVHTRPRVTFTSPLQHPQPCDAHPQRLTPLHTPAPTPKRSPHGLVSSPPAFLGPVACPGRVEGMGKEGK